MVAIDPGQRNGERITHARKHPALLGERVPPGGERCLPRRDAHAPRGPRAAADGCHSADWGAIASKATMLRIVRSYPERRDRTS